MSEAIILSACMFKPRAQEASPQNMKTGFKVHSRKNIFIQVASPGIHPTMSALQHLPVARV